MHRTHVTITSPNNTPNLFCQKLPSGRPYGDYIKTLDELLEQPARIVLIAAHTDILRKHHCLDLRHRLTERGFSVMLLTCDPENELTEKERKLWTYSYEPVVMETLTSGRSVLILSETGNKTIFHKLIAEKTYEPQARPLISLDLAVFTLIQNRIHLMHTKRRCEPDYNKQSLITGVIHPDTDPTPEHAIQHLIYEHFNTNVLYSTSMGAHSHIQRDPRGWSISLLYAVFIAPENPLNTEHYTQTAINADLPEEGQWAFDHYHLAKHSINTLKKISEHNLMPATFYPHGTTIPNLIDLYGSLWHEQPNIPNMRRKLMSTDQFQLMKAQIQPERGRPASLYILKENAHLDVKRSLRLN